MNYLSFTSYSGWRKKFEPTYRNMETKRFFKKRDSEKLEGNLQMRIQTHPLLSSLSCKKL